MKRLIMILVSAVGVLVSAAGIQGQDVLVPAGTLLQCTLDEPNFSSATAAVGDPVLCHLRTMQEFGKQLFPRGSMLGGHLEADQEPGHFWGKGYLRVTFDRVILPNGDLPVPAKVIQARGFKVDKQGDIDGKGHAKRDVAEWMIPPLWPWKVVTLPLKGPRPTLKGEEPLELRLMDDIVVPRLLAYGPMKPDRPPDAFSPAQPSGPKGSPTNAMQPAVEKGTTSPERQPAPPSGGSAERFTVLVLKSNQVYELSKYRVNGEVLEFQQVNGTPGTVGVDQVDWRKTTEMTADVRSVDMPAMARQIN